MYIEGFFRGRIIQALLIVCVSRVRKIEMCFSIGIVKEMSAELHFYFLVERQNEMLWILFSDHFCGAITFLIISVTWSVR